MDLNKKIEDLTQVKVELDELLKLTREAARCRTEYEAATKEPAKDEEDAKYIARLEHRLNAAQKRADDQLKKYGELRAKVAKDIHGDTTQELSVFQENGDATYETEADAVKRVGNPYMAGKTEVEMKDYERKQSISKAEEIIAQNEEYIKNIDAKIDEALRNGDESALEGLKRQKANLEVENKRQAIQIEKLSRPYRAIEDSEAEYEALYGLKKAMEKTSELGEPASVADASEEAKFIDEQLAALQGVATAIDESIPAGDRYNAAKAQKDEFTKKKLDAKKLILSLTEKLAKGEIKREYVDSVRARIEEIKGEVAQYEAEEQKCADRMKDLEERFDLKPEPTAMEKLEAQMAQFKKLEALEARKQADLDKINEELAKEGLDEATKAKLEKDKAALEADLEKIRVAKPGIEKGIADAKKALGLDDKDLSEGDGKGGHGEEDDGKGEPSGDEKGEDGDGKGGPLAKIVDGKRYYDRANPVDKYLLKLQAYRRDKDLEPSIFRKAFLFLRSPRYAKIAQEKLETGEVTPLEKDVKFGNVPYKEDEMEDKKGTGKDTSKVEEPKKDPFVLSEEDKKKVEQGDADRRAKAQIDELLKKLPPEERAKVEAAMKASQSADKPAPAKKEQKDGPVVGE